MECSGHNRRRSILRLHYSLVFLLVAVVAGALGLGGVAVSAIEIARICFLIFIVMFLVSVINGRSPGRSR